jgi:hypothetical protein
VCEIEAEGNRQLGDAIAKALRSRLADCEAASTVSDLLVGRPMELGDGTIAIELLGNGSSMVFTANHPDVPMTPSGKVDWAKVQSIRVLRIESRK